MHRRTEASKLLLDTELERTLINLKKERAAKAIMAEQREVNHNTPFAADIPQQRQRIMEDFWRPVIRDEYSALRQPTIEANKFELNPALITMV